AAGDEQRRPAHALEGADGAVDPAGKEPLAALEEPLGRLALHPRRTSTGRCYLMEPSSLLASLPWLARVMVYSFFCFCSALAPLSVCLTSPPGTPSASHHSWVPLP